MTSICRSFLCPLALMTASGASAQSATLSVKGVNEAGTHLLLAGMAQGIGSANFFLRMEGRGLYCPPRKVLTTPDLIRRMAALKLQGPQKPDVIAIAAVDGLRKKFPCR